MPPAWVRVLANLLEPAGYVTLTRKALDDLQHARREEVLIRIRRGDYDTAVLDRAGIIMRRRLP